MVIELRKPSVKLSTLSSDHFGCCHFWNVCEKGKACPFVHQFDDLEFAQRCSIYKQFVSIEETIPVDNAFVLFPQTGTIKNLICAWESLIKNLLGKPHDLYISDFQFKEHRLELTLSKGNQNSNNVFESIIQTEHAQSTMIQSHFLKQMSIHYFITQAQTLIHTLNRHLICTSGWNEVLVKWEEPYFYFDVMKKIKQIPVSLTMKEPLIDREDTTDHLLLIDGSSLLTRSYYATMKTAELKTSTGKYTNAVLPMVRMLFQLLAEFQPTHMAIGWDKGRNTWRRKIYKEYKANRKETEPALKEQFGTAQDLYGQMGIFQYGNENFEADDVIGTLSKRWIAEKKGRVTIITGDRDFLQLLDDQVIIFFPDKGVTKKERFSLQEMRVKHGFTSPRQFVELKGILGDTSDNLPGVKGIGDKKAYPLIQRYNTLENIYDHLDEIEHDPQLKRCVIPLDLYKESAFLSRDLAILQTDMPDYCKYHGIN